MPAQTLRLKERGIIRAGLYADLTIFDRHTFKEKANFSNPYQYSQCLMHLIVNGELVVDNGKYAGNLPGMIIYGYGKTSGAKK